MSDIHERYYVSGSNVVFTRRRFIFHTSFALNYLGMTMVEARRKLRERYTKGEQNDILHYLKQNNFLKHDQ